MLTLVSNHLWQTAETVTIFCSSYHQEVKSLSTPWIWAGLETYFDQDNGRNNGQVPSLGLKSLCSYFSCYGCNRKTTIKWAQASLLEVLWRRTSQPNPSHLPTNLQTYEWGHPRSSSHQPTLHLMADAQRAQQRPTELYSWAQLKLLIQELRVYKGCFKPLSFEEVY